MEREIMTKNDFLSQLRHHLRNLPIDEVDSAITYYREYLEDAGEEHLEETLQVLGSPREVATGIRANRMERDIHQSPPSPKKGVSAVWVVILCIFASPIALPLAIAAAAIIITLAIALFAVLIILLAIVFGIIVIIAALCVGLTLGGVFYICLSLPLFVQHFATGLFFLGSGMAMTGIGLMIFPGLLALSRICWKGTAHFIGHTLPSAIAKLSIKRRKVR